MCVGMGDNYLLFFITLQMGFYYAFLGSKSFLRGLLMRFQKTALCCLPSSAEGLLKLMGEDMSILQCTLQQINYILMAAMQQALPIYSYSQLYLNNKQQDISLNMKSLSFLLGLLCLASYVQAAYNPSVAREMAYMSAIAYESAVSIQAWNCKLCSEYKIVLPKVFINLTSGVRGFTGYSTSLNSIIVSFKGADSINTFINQLKTARESFQKCANCEVSKSFNELYLTAQPSVLNQIESLHRLYRNAGVFVTGHGLGGAFAILAATDIKSLYQSTDAVYTFGQPRVGNDAFASYYAKYLPDTYRVINNADIVPHLPATNAGYQHSSLEEWYQNGMTTYKTCEGESPSCSNSIPPQSWNLNDNSINAYICISTNGSPQLAREV